MDNTATQEVVDNGDAQSVSTDTTSASNLTSTDAASIAQNWKGSLRTDLRDSPFAKKFEDNPDGLNKMLESYGNLEKLLGHEKVPIPKGPEDVEGWNRFSKALGIPDKAQGYGLPDAALPESMKGITIDKNQFAEVAHAHKLTPSQAKGLWETYQKINVDLHNKAMQKHQESLVNAVNALKGQWGDAYETNVELGQMVINKFSDDQQMNDYITSVLSQDPRGIKFLAKIGGQFAETKVGEFQMKRFSKAPDEARNEIQKISRDPKHPYNDPNATEADHQAAVDYVNSLWATVNRAKG